MAAFELAMQSAILRKYAPTHYKSALPAVLKEAPRHPTKINLPTLLAIYFAYSSGV